MLLPPTMVVVGGSSASADALSSARRLGGDPGLDLAGLYVEHVRIVAVGAIAAGGSDEPVRARGDVPVPEPGVLLPTGVAPGHNGLRPAASALVDPRDLKKISSACIPVLLERLPLCREGGCALAV